MDPASLKEQAPATYKVRLDTSAGPVVIQVTRAWAPLGADRFYNLVKNGFYDGARFFRVLSGFMAQCRHERRSGIQKLWSRANFNDDPVKGSNKRGFVTFAKTGAPNSRSTQFFINYGDTLPRQAGVHAVRRSDLEAWRRSTSSQLRQGERAGPGPHASNEGNAYLHKELPEARLHQEGDDRDSRCVTPKKQQCGDSS